MTDLPRLSPAHGVAVIIGASSDLGTALAMHLARRGVNLALVDNDHFNLAYLKVNACVYGVKVTVHPFDLSKDHSFEPIAESVVVHHGAVTILVNAGGSFSSSDFKDSGKECLRTQLQLNFNVAVEATRTFLPVMELMPSAQIVNISSISSLIAPAGHTAYAASEFASRGFTEALSHELTDTGSRVGISLVIAGMTRWQTIGKTNALEAAHRIANGIEVRKPLIFLTPEAHRAYWLARLLPSKSWNWIYRKQYESRHAELLTLE